MRDRRRHGGFTLIELLTATVILALLIVMLVKVAGQTSHIWLWSHERIQTFQNARGAFQSITQSLRLATLNAYWDYDDPETPRHYLRKSDLGFYTGPAREALGVAPNTGSCAIFYAPGGKTGLNAVRGLSGMMVLQGYYVDYGEDPSLPPFHLAEARHRFRLMKSVLSGEQSRFARFFTGWKEADLHTGNAHPVAENVIALILRPMKYDAEGDLQLLGSPDDPAVYDSTAHGDDHPQARMAHQLPPVVEVTLIAVGETSYARAFGGGAAVPPEIVPPTLFQDPANHEADLAEMEKILRELKLEYRIFSTRVGLRGARWSGGEDA